MANMDGTFGSGSSEGRTGKTIATTAGIHVRKPSYAPDTSREPRTVFGVYKSRDATENAVERLKRGGFKYSDISVLMADKHTARGLDREAGSKAPEGATTGASAGLVLGGTFGWLAGIGALAIPGVGPLVAAGPIMGALAGAGLGGTIGGISGALIGFGIPELEARHYEGVVKDGYNLISIHCETLKWSDRAQKILRETGARDIVCSADPEI